MVRSALVMVMFAVMPPADATSTSSPFTCPIPTTNEWLKPSPRVELAGFIEVDDSLVQPVSRSLPAAVAMLEKEPAVPISPEQVRQFTGEAARSRAGIQPYLVRAVYPSARPTIGVSWLGDDLHVFAGGLGCAPYEKHPIVIYLGKRPRNVFVKAVAAL